MDLTWQQSIGIDQQHLVDFKTSISKSYLIHRSIKQDLQNLFLAARNDNMEMVIISSFRTFDRQLSIWNDKWQGYRPVYSRHGRPLNIEHMSEMEKFKAISLWSALPGLSRHHWGTDLDIFLSEPLKNEYKVKLVPQEFSETGVCCKLNHWLDTNLERFGFFRPYKTYQQGVSEEPWHISHRLTSQKILTTFPFEQCLEYLNQSKIKSKPFICDMFEHYQEQYFLNLCLSSN